MYATIRLLQIKIQVIPIGQLGKYIITFVQFVNNYRIITIDRQRSTLIVINRMTTIIILARLFVRIYRIRKRAKR